MIFRNLSLAFASSLVATGAWYAYTGGSESSAVSGTSTTLSSPIHTASNAAITSALSSGVQVESDQFYTTASVDQPVSKRTDNSGERVVGMLTPEQATERLRRNEESYFIGRGSGVVRYDVVQLPSNDPIEDDHAEKVVEVPSSVAATDNGAPTSDWNFWGVFDGHA